MSMNIQRGKVGYKGVDNYSCFFGSVGETVYYFIDPNGLKLYYETDNIDVNTFKLPNGNIVVTSLLNEAVDPQIKAVNIGLINENGDVVIPLENRKVVRLKDDLLLVEKAVPTSQSVLDAVEMRNDPSAATQLVSTTASIKDQITTAMGGEAGQYIFNDMLSEATITDLDGNNLLGGEYYSFMCMSGDGAKLALSKNVLSTVMMFDMASKTVAPMAAQQTEIDVTATGADETVVEEAMAGAGDTEDEVVMPIADEGVEPASEEAVMPIEDETDMFDIAPQEEEKTMTLPSADELNAFTVGEGVSEEGAPAETAPEEAVASAEGVVSVPEGIVPIEEDVAPIEETAPEEMAPVGEETPTEETVLEEGAPVETAPEEVMASAGEVVSVPEDVVPIGEDVASTEETASEEMAPVGEETPVEGMQLTDVAADEFKPGEEFDIPKVEEDGENTEEAEYVPEGVTLDGEVAPMEEIPEEEMNTVGENPEEVATESEFDSFVQKTPAETFEEPVDETTEEPMEEETNYEPENLFDVNPTEELIPQEGAAVEPPVTELEQAMSGPVTIDPDEVAAKVDRDGNGTLDSEENTTMDLFKEQSSSAGLDLGDIPLGTGDSNHNGYIDSASELMMPVSRDLSYGYDEVYSQYPVDSESEFMRNVATTLRRLIDNDKEKARIIQNDGHTIQMLRDRNAVIQGENNELRYRVEQLMAENEKLARRAQGNDEVRRLLRESESVLGYGRRAA